MIVTLLSIFVFTGSVSLPIASLTPGGPPHGQPVAQTDPQGGLRARLRSDPKLVYVRGRFGKTLLHTAAGEGRGDEVKLLVQHGASVEARDDYQRTPLFDAVSAGQREAVHLLIGYGAKVNVTDKHGATPLSTSVELGRAAIASDLVKAGAQGDIFQLAAAGATREAITLARSNPSLLTQVDRFGLTPLYWASINGWVSTAQALTRAGAVPTLCTFAAVGDVGRLRAALDTSKPQPINRGPEPALNCAVKRRQTAAVSFLLSRHADPNSYGADGLTPLDLAAEQGDREIVVQLLDAGADPLRRTANGRLAEHFALSSRHESVADLIQARIARR